MDVSVDALESLLARGRRSLQGLLLKDEGDG
jgi:RNA polymerase sigma-70 factor (ECF subfamily)